MRRSPCDVLVTLVGCDDVGELHQAGFELEKAVLSFVAELAVMNDSG